VGSTLTFRHGIRRYQVHYGSYHLHSR
jgi:hypothetical protein